MFKEQLRRFGPAAVAAAGLAAALPAAAALIPMDGTVYLSGGGASPVGRCAPALTIFNAGATANHSNHGSFVFDSSECISPPLPTTTFDGTFSFEFATGTVFGTTYSVLSDSGTPGVFELDGAYVVTGGTGAFQGATGELQKRGLLDRREFPPKATAVIGFVGSVNTIPEPQTYALMLGGLALLMLKARRRS